MSRRQAREFAFKTLFECAIRPEAIEDLNEALPRQLDDEETRQFATDLINGTLDHAEEINDIIKRHATNWDIKRIAQTEKTLLSMALFELLYCEDIPTAVTLDEVIELAKIYGSSESPGFLNGVLDSFSREHHG